MPKITAWVVTCYEFHRAVGPFMVEAEALDMAKQLTAKGGCVYLPVPLELEAQVVKMPEPKPESKDKDRGYL
jgi:hypothetical protein